MSSDETQSGPSPELGFHLEKVRSVRVTRHAKMSDSRDNPNKARVSVIDDAETIARLTVLVNKLPAKGKKFIKLGDVEWIRAAFYGDRASPLATIDLFNGMVQAPDTSFYGRLPIENEIYRILSRAKPRPAKASSEPVVNWDPPTKRGLVERALSDGVTDPEKIVRWAANRNVPMTTDEVLRLEAELKKK